MIIYIVAILLVILAALGAPLFAVILADFTFWVSIYP